MNKRRRFNPNAVASSTGDHTRISHDRRAGTTGRTTKRVFARCGYKLIAVTAVQAATMAASQLVYKL